MTSPSLVKDTAFNTASFAVRMVGTVIALAWVATALGPELQGRFGYVHWIAVIAGQVGLWGLGIAMTRFVAQQVGAGDPSAARATIGEAARWLKSTLVAVGFAGLAGAWFLGSELRTALLVAVLYAGVIATSGFFVGVAHGLRRFDVVFGADVVYYTLLLVTIPLGLGASDAVLGTLIVFAGARTVFFGLLGGLTRRPIAALGPPTPIPGPLRWELGHYAVNMAILTLLGAVLWERTELFFLKALGDYRALGFFTAAVGLSILVSRVPGVLGQVMLPVVAGMHGGAASQADIGRAYRRGARLLSLLVVGPVCIGIAAGPAIVQVLLDDEYKQAAALFRILLVPMLLSGIGVMGAKTLIGAGGTRQLVWLTSWMAAAKLWLCLALVPRWGALGAAVAVAAAQTVGLALEGALAARRYPVLANAEPSRWMEQAFVGAWALAGTLAAGFVIGGAERGTSPQLALVVQGFGGLAAMAIAMRLYKPLPAADGALLKEALPERLGRWLDQLSIAQPPGS